MDTSTFFTCVHCGHLSPTVKKHELHFSSHRHLSRKIVCGYKSCSSVLPNGPAFRAHVTRAHRKRTEPHQPSALSPVNENSQYQCPVEYCGELFFHSRLLNSHVKEHMRSGITCPCFQPGCTKKFSVWNSLTGHMTKCHRKPAPSEVMAGSAYTAESDPSFHSFENEDAALPAIISEDNTVETQPEESLRTIAQFYQRLAYKHLVPQSTIQIVAEELKTLMCSNQQILLDNINVSLTNSQVPSEVINHAFESATQKNNLATIFHELRTDHIRKKCFKSLFSFVEPQPVSLGDEKFFYYVPIDESLEACFKYRPWGKYFKSGPEANQDGVLRDFSDGEAFKNNSFFIANPNGIKIILYQDGFELVNPIGPAKNLNHNVIGVYMALGNLPSHVRFQKYFIQLVALCKKEWFDQKLVYGKIVDEVIKLQNAGCNVPSVGNVKVGLAFIAGDNLGSHALGGFLENFSKSTYFCRYCLLSRSLFLSAGGEVRNFQSRTVESYVNAVSQVSDQKKSCFGVKFDSEFNRVQGFHVCDNGLPPCLGHDLCEGVIAYDLKLFIQYFVTNKVFSQENLNDAIKNFPYSVEDRRDKPVIIKKLEKPKLAGGAWQIRTFLRLFPLMVSEFVDYNDQVWDCVLRLGEITDIIVAPEIHVSQLSALQCLVEEYLVLRREIFPSDPLRPKHHYMFHYADLTLQHGPLIKVWTMRFESKHTTFKRGWRSSQNSKNILKTLSFKHEYLQSFIRSGGGTKFEIDGSKRSKFTAAAYSSAIISAVSSVGHLSSFEFCSHVSIKGTQYRKGQIVIVKQSDVLYHDALEIGTIFMILIDVNDTVSFLIKKGRGKLCPLTRAFKITSFDEFQCIAANDLVSYYPLTPYVIDRTKYICLKHSIVNGKVGYV